MGVKIQNKTFTGVADLEQSLREDMRLIGREAWQLADSTKLKSVASVLNLRAI